MANTTETGGGVGADFRKRNGWPIKRAPDVSADREDGGISAFGLRRTGRLVIIKKLKQEDKVLITNG